MSTFGSGTKEEIAEELKNTLQLHLDYLKDIKFLDVFIILTMILAHYSQDYVVKYWTEEESK